MPGTVGPSGNGGGAVSGSGTANTVAKFTGVGTVGNSQITDNGATSTVTINSNSFFAKTLTLDDGGGGGRLRVNDVNSDAIVALGGGRFLAC